MKYKLLAILFICAGKLIGQELFVVTDPASNVPANSLSVNLMNSLFDELDGGMNYHLMPEFTYGINKSLMVRGSTFISNRSNKLYAEGSSVMAKYRFLSIDELNSHFRMAMYGRYSFNRADIHQEQIEILGHNSGFEVGLIATKLLHKVALNSTISFEKALDNTSKYEYPKSFGDKATNYTFSVGRLMYPKKYSSFRETNVNLMIEFVGQTITGNGKSFLDIVPAIQFIIRSQARIDLAYRHELFNEMNRTAPNGIYLNFYFTFFKV